MTTTCAIAARGFNVLALGLATVASTACSDSATANVSNWMFECVGRMQLGMPGDVDVAALVREDIQSEVEQPSHRPRYVFKDGQRAYYSSLRYEGRMSVTHDLDDQALVAIVERARAERERIRLSIQEKPATREGRLRKFSLPQTSSPSSVAYQIAGDRVGYELLSVVGSSVLLWSSSAQLGDSSSSDALKRVDLARPRRLHEVPSEPGVCLPYTFVPDDGEPRRAVSVTYRLRSHPDVTIWLEDSTAAGLSPGMNPKKFTPEAKTEFFWFQNYQDPNKFKWIWKKPKDVTLAGYKGVASFVELERRDGTIDYGYLAVVRGEPTAKEDTPDLMLYVIRDAKNATAKGMKPVDKDRFIEMAQAIAASVKRRPVKQ